MANGRSATRWDRLPIKQDLNRFELLTVFLVGLVLIGSLAGILFPTDVYSGGGVVAEFLPNDIVSLLLGVPTLLMGLALSRRGRWTGLPLWLGAVLAAFYNAIAYVVGATSALHKAANLLVVGLAVYLSLSLLFSIDAAAISQRLQGAVPARVSGVILSLFGGAFGLRAIGMLLPAFSERPALASAELAVLIADLVSGALWVVAGVLLWRRTPLGYLLGSSVLFQTAILFVGLVLFLLLQPAMMGTAARLGEALQVLLMGLPVYLLLGLFLRSMKADRGGATS